MRKVAHINNYDAFVFIIIISTIYGWYSLIHASNFVSVLLFPQLLKNSYVLSLKKIKPLALFLLFWNVYSLFSLFWTPDLHDGLVDSAILFFDSILFLELIVFSMKANHPVQTLANAWACAFFITSIIALWELGTEHHLASAKEMSLYRTNADGDYMVKRVAIVTFYNPNTYCYFICLAFPFILYIYAKSKNRLVYLRNLIILLFVIIIMSQNSSRGGLLSLLIMSSAFVFYKMQRSSFQGRMTLIICLLVIVFFFYLFGDVIFQALYYRLSKHDIFEDNARTLLWMGSLQAFVDSNGFGMGVGSMFTVLNKYSLVFGINCTHNMLLEILLEYGWMMALGIILYLFKLYNYSRRFTDVHAKAVIKGAIFAFPFYSVINSENLRSPFIWLFFASLFAFSIHNIKINNLDKLGTGRKLSIKIR